MRDLFPQTRRAEASAPAPLACSIEQAAQVLGISRTSLFHLIKGGALCPIKIGRRTLFPIKVLETYLEQLGSAR